MGIEGVGEKVADCILLFAYERQRAFPVDTWIRKVMRWLYFDGEPVPDREIQRLAVARFGPFAGYAQEYLYAWSRRHLRRTRLTSVVNWALRLHR